MIFVPNCADFALQHHCTLDLRVDAECHYVVFVITSIGHYAKGKRSFFFNVLDNIDTETQKQITQEITDLIIDIESKAQEVIAVSEEDQHE